VCVCAGVGGVHGQVSSMHMCVYMCVCVCVCVLMHAYLFLVVQRTKL
jgi:hypothetical protein